MMFHEKILKKIRDMRRASDPWNKRLPTFATRKGQKWVIAAYLLLSIVFLIMYLETFEFRKYCLPVLYFTDDDPEPDSQLSAKISDLGLTELERTAVIEDPPTEETSDAPDLCLLLVTAIVSLLIIGLGFLMFVLMCFQLYHEHVFIKAITRHYNIDEALSNELRDARIDFIEKNPECGRHTETVTEEEFGLHTFNAHLWQVPKLKYSREVKAKWSRFIFGPLWSDATLIIKVVLYIHDLLRAVEYMHRRNVYHLDLWPAMVSVHWSEYTKTLLNFSKENDDSSVLYEVFGVDTQGKAHSCSSIVLSSLEFAVYSENGRVLSEEVGTTVFYSPPERFTEIEVDACKVDSWGVGVIAYEMLTGGMLAIQSVKGSPTTPQVRCDTVLQQFLEKKYFNTSVDASYMLLENFTTIRYKEDVLSRYRFDPTEFLTDCLNFVKGLLESDPDKRLSCRQALKTPLMKKVHEDRVKLPHLFHINYPFEEDTVVE